MVIMELIEPCQIMLNVDSMELVVRTQQCSHSYTCFSQKFCQCLQIPNIFRCWRIPFIICLDLHRACCDYCILIFISCTCLGRNYTSHFRPDTRATGSSPSLLDLTISYDYSTDVNANDNDAPRPSLQQLSQLLPFQVLEHITGGVGMVIVVVHLC